MRDNSFPVYFENAPRNWWFVAKRRVVQSVLDWMVRQAPLGRVVDLGCGTGEIVASLGSETSIAVDISREALSYTRQRGVTNLLQADSRQLPLRDGSLDTIFCFDHMEHLVEDRRFLQDVVRLLKPGGRIILTVPAHEFLWSPRDEEIHHHHRYSRRKLGRMARSAGLEVLRTTHSNMLLLPPLALYVLYRRLEGWHVEQHSDDADLFIPHPLVNRFLAALLSIDARLLRWVDIPFGTSLLMVARRPGSLDEPAR